MAAKHNNCHSNHLHVQYELYVWTFLLCMYGLNVFKYIYCICECTVYYPLRCVVVLVKDYAGNNTSTQTGIKRIKKHFFPLSDATSESLVLYLLYGHNFQPPCPLIAHWNENKRCHLASFRLPFSPLKLS